MALKLVVAVTDTDWFKHLSARPSLEEVNFWAPSVTPFRALQPGELFLFKLHSPLNFIVGGGIFAYANELPCSLAWDAFGEANGANSLEEMRQRIARYRRNDGIGRSEFSIGCRILTQPFFWPESKWLPAPSSWAKNIVSFKTYSTDDEEGLRLWQNVNDRMLIGPILGVSEPRPRFGEPVPIRPRLGQGAFRILVTDNYHRRCAVTLEKTLPALDAAHIRPYREGGGHEPQNGLLLRRDIHKLFDDGYVTVTPSLFFEVSPRIREEFENGRHYYELHGRRIAVPDSPSALPDRDALDWHNRERFQRPSMSPLVG